MFRNLLYLFASIALVSAQSTNSTSSQTTVTTGSPTINKTSTTTVSPPSSTSNISSSTESAANTSTTASPKISTTLTPVTTVAPIPPPIPKPEKWSGNVTENNRTCINVEFSVQITITYNSSIDDKTLTTGFTIPVNASVDPKGSHCSQGNKTELEIIDIRFENLENTSANLVLTFNKTDDDQIIVEAIKLTFKATRELMPQLNDTLFNKYLTAEATNLDLFKVKSEHSYLCSAGKSANLLGDYLNGVQIQFTDSQVEAYIKDSQKGKFDIVMDCKSADISDVVPIAVGAALAGLVIIVLIAYFVGRRRSRRLAYQSV
jgi:lysosomal-associated membrane protein 1/2